MLAFACAFTMFAGAAFTDEADINADNRDAVELLTALNIIQGYEDGSFDPEGTVTRAEMAKMIYTIRNGGNDDASAYETVTTTFQDINGHWAEGYIKYLQNTGIVAGNSPTEFDPDSQVTTGEAMKMALVLSGYDATNAELTGISWLNNTVSLATTVGMTKDVASAIASGCTRQDAAQILSNTLTEVYAVRWSAIVEDFVPDSKSGLAYAGSMITVGEKWMDLAVATGFISKGPSSKTNPKGIRFYPNDGYLDDVQNTRGFIDFRDTTIDVTDLAGYEVKVVWDSDHEDSVNGVYGVYKTDNNTSWEVMWKDVKADGTNKVKFDGDTFDTESSINVYANGYDTTVKTTLNSSDFDEAAVADIVVFIDNDGDGTINAVQYKTQNVAKITYVGNNKLNTGNLIGDDDATPVDWFNDQGYDVAPDLDDVNTYDGIAKDDYAKVTYDYYNDKVTYEKIDVVEATVEATRTNAGTKEIRIGGNWYKAAVGYTLPSIVSGDSVAYVAIDNLLYNVEKIDGTWGSKNLAMVYDVQDYTLGTRSGDLEVALITRDGSKITATLDEYNGTEVKAIYSGSTFSGWDINDDGTAEWNSLGAAQTALKNVLMTYRESGSEVSLMAASRTQKAGYDDVYQVNGTSAFSTSSDMLNAKMYDDELNTWTSSADRNIADDAIVFVYDSDASTAGAYDAKVISGKDLKNLTGTIATVNNACALGGSSNGVDYVQAMVVGMDALPTVKGNNYAYVISAAETVSGDDYRWFELWTENGFLEAYEVSSDEYEYDGGEIVTYDLVSTGERTIITNVTRVDETNDAYTTHVGSIVSDGFYGSNKSMIGIKAANGVSYAYELASDCVVLNVDTENGSGIEGDAKAGAREAYEDNGALVKNVVYIYDNDDKLIFVLVDGENGKLKDNWSDLYVDPRP